MVKDNCCSKSHCAWGFFFTWDSSSQLPIQYLRIAGYNLLIFDSFCFVALVINKGPNEFAFVNCWCASFIAILRSMLVVVRFDLRSFNPVFSMSHYWLFCALCCGYGILATFIILSCGIVLSNHLVVSNLFARFNQVMLVHERLPIHVSCEFSPVFHVCGA